jgi:ABC-type uncharacterized transport system permease subunit
MDSFKLYRLYLSQSIKSQLEYRASTFMQITGQFLINIIEFTGVWALLPVSVLLRGGPWKRWPSAMDWFTPSLLSLISFSGALILWGT